MRLFGKKSDYTQPGQQTRNELVALHNEQRAMFKHQADVQASYVEGLRSSVQLALTEIHGALNMLIKTQVTRSDITSAQEDLKLAIGLLEPLLQQGKRSTEAQPD